MKKLYTKETTAKFNAIVLGVVLNFDVAKDESVEFDEETARFVKFTAYTVFCNDVAVAHRTYKLEEHGNEKVIGNWGNAELMCKAISAAE